MADVRFGVVLSVVRLLGVRNTSAAVGLGLLAAGLGVLGAGSSGPAAIRYELNAPLGVTGGRVFACFSYALMDPVSCAGIEVKGIDISHLPDGSGDRGLPYSQPMRLVGTWDGRALTLTEAPQPAQAPSPPQMAQSSKPSAAASVAQTAPRANAAPSAKARGRAAGRSNGVAREVSAVLGAGISKTGLIAGRNEKKRQEK